MPSIDYVIMTRDPADEWRWVRFSGANGNKLSMSSEGYDRRIDCLDQAFKCNVDLPEIRIEDGDTTEVLSRTSEAQTPEAEA